MRVTVLFDNPKYGEKIFIIETMHNFFTEISPRLKEGINHAKFSKEKQESNLLIQNIVNQLKKITRRKQKFAYDRLELINYLKNKYGFNGFIHCTDFKNFISIMNKGVLYSRNLAIESGLLQTDSANRHIISNTRDDAKKYVRFYFRCKTPTYYVNEGIKRNNSEPHMPIPVILIFKEEICFNLNSMFSDGNVASKSKTIVAYDINLIKEFDWEEIFNDDENWHCDREVKRIRNAEFLYPKQISAENVKKIVFRSEPDLEMAKHFLGDNDLFSVNSDMFVCNNLYLIHYKIVLRDNCIVMVLFFSKESYHLNYFSEHITVKYNNNDIKSVDLHESDIVRKNYREFPRMVSYVIKDEKYENIKGVTYFLNKHMSAIKTF